MQQQFSFPKWQRKSNSRSQGASFIFRGRGKRVYHQKWQAGNIRKNQIEK